MPNIVSKNTTPTLQDVEFRYFPEAHIREFLREATANVVRQVHDQGFDVVVFLDRAARFYGHLFKHSWEQAYPGIACPHILFANIGREKQSAIQGGDLIFRDDTYLEMASELDRVIGSRFDLTNKKIAILDDDIATGASVRGARDTFALAFPQAAYVGLGSFSAYKDEFRYFDIQPIINKLGSGLWYTIPKLPSGPETGPVILLPEGKYLTERRELIKNRSALVKQIDSENDLVAARKEKAGLVKDWLAEEREFCDDYLERVYHESSVAAIDKFIESKRIILDLSEDDLDAKNAAGSQFRSKGLNRYLDKLSSRLEAEIELIDTLLVMARERVRDWNDAVSEAKRIVKEEA